MAFLPAKTRLCFRHFPHGGSSELTSDESAIGTLGVLTIATRGADGPGEVRLRIRGGTELYRAWSEKPLREGTTVLIIESRGKRTVDVIPWTDPLNEAPRITDTHPGFPGGQPPQN